MDFAVPVEYQVKLKEGEKRDRYIDIARELRNLGNMKVAVMPIIIVALGTIFKALVKRLEELEITGQVDTNQITALLRSARILRRVLET